MTALSSLTPHYFVDTNIWLYAFMVGQDAAKSAKAQATIHLHVDNIIISTQVVNEVCVNLLKKAQLPESDIKPIIEAFFQRYRIAEITEDVLLKSSDLRTQHKFPIGIASLLQLRYCRARLYLCLKIWTLP